MRRISNSRRRRRHSSLVYQGVQDAVGLGNGGSKVWGLGVLVGGSRFGFAV